MQSRLPERGVRRALVSLMAGVLMIAGLAACGSDDSSTATSASDPLAGYRENGVTIAISNAAPYSQPGADGQPSGYGPEVAAAVLKRMGITDITTRTAQFDAMIPGLQAGQWDMVAGGLVQNPERCEQVLFSNPDYVTETAVMVKAGNPEGITTAADMIGKDVKAAEPPGTAEMIYLDNAGVDASQIVTVPDIQAAAAALKAGRADVVFADVPSLKAHVPDGFEVIKDTGRADVGTGFAFKADDAAFRDAFEAALAEVVADGTVEQIARRTEMPDVDPAVIAATTREDLNPDVPACLR